ncbi:MAG: hypothetical protein IJY09_07720 [Lachnospiraceae bacterium]|nr:hypothetical protein [Lachnospiraceae bacterium]
MKMFGFFKKAKTAKQLDTLLQNIQLNLSNNYKDAAQEDLRELERRLQASVEAGELSAAQQEFYESRLSALKVRLKNFTHKDQKTTW